MKVNPIDCYQFHVKDLDKEEVVNLQTKECTCKEFQVEQLPCSHAIAAARDRNINDYSLYANYYTNECLLAAYAEVVYPVGNQSNWKTSEDYVHMTVLPPKVVKRVGRSKNKRIPSVGEAPKLHKMVVPSDKYFPATVSCQVHKIGNQLIHHFLLRQIPEDGNVDGICFSVLGKNFKDKSTREKEAYELKKTTTSKAVVWADEVLSTASEHLTTRNSKGLILRILRWNCTQAPSYKMLQKNIFDNKNTVVKPKLKLSTQEKAFMESRIRGDDNIQMEDDESIRDTPDHSEMHPITNKKHCRSKKSNDKEQQSHSKSYKKLKKEIKEVRKDLSTLTSIVCRMDDTIRKQSLELSEMKLMLERLVENDNDDQNREDMITSDQAEHQQESGSDISIVGGDVDLLMTIRDILDNLNAKSQKEKDLPVVITTLPLVIQPLALCEMASLDQTVQIHEVSPSISIVNEESQLETIKQHVEIHKNDEAVTLVEKEPVTVPDKDEEQKTNKEKKAM
ncbi:MuDRA-like transposase [Cucumis melo var. makuwa]|uniref:MuDRA-like transposase n=1 Tax=Cucumis melo var. makuwa TaxID=1194695 RepID=A0A5D3DCQ7_CUCMM|nr:MuDRA-like transposase [Cucumis melo var. makuwa]